MTRTVFWTSVLCLSLVSVGEAQTVTGSGTPGNIAKFTGSSTIGDSVVLQSNGNIGIGTATPGFALEVVTSSTANPFNRPGVAAGVYSEITASPGAGVLGLASATEGTSFGVAGVTFNPSGIGVEGNHAVSAAGGGGGVHGQTSATNGFAYGVSGTAIGSTGPAVGVVGQTFSPDGTGGLFDNAAGGDILVGGIGQPAVAVFRVNGHGMVFADGGFRPFGADFAESLPVRGNRAHYAPGDLLVIDPSGQRRLALSDTPYSTQVAGIHSTKPGVVASQHSMDDSSLGNEVPLAVVGIVPCKVTAENGPIAAGDLLVTSSTAGHAMKGTDRARMLGAVVGKALEPLQAGTGVIQVLVTLQ